MANAAAVKLNQSVEARALLSEVQEAHRNLQTSLSELERVISQPELNSAALTSVRLKIASMRLTRGALIKKVAELLAGRVTDSEAMLVSELRSSHSALLETCSLHTRKWTLNAIARDWQTYRRETRELLGQWIRQADDVRRQIHPLIERCASGR